jgi:DNA repair photolyase/transcriptional regulator with XRE-family HTH domain
VIKQAPATLSIGSEQTWAITSVDSSQDIQVLNRQLPINTDDSIKLTEEVNKRIIERYARGEVQLPLDETVLVCRAIFQILRDQDKIGVRIPFRERIEWLDTSNRRNPSIFMDLLISITALNRYQREQDAEGYYLATAEDFKTAKALFTDKDAEELVKRLTVRERDVIDQLIGNSSGLTRDELAEKMKVASDRISQILNGQKGSGGLKQKVQIAKTKKSETITVNKDTADEKRITIYKTVYSLKDYDRFTGFDAVVRLKLALDEPVKPPKHGLSNQLSKTTDSSEDQLSKISEKEKERGERDKKDIGSLAEDFSRENEKKTKFAKLVEPDSESTYLAGAKPGLASLAGLKDSGIKADFQRAEVERKAKADHDRELREKHTNRQDPRAKAEHYRTHPKLNIIYRPGGAALEYAELACNPWIGCTHGCLYCYGPSQFHKTKDEYLIPELKNIVLTKLDADLIKLKLTSSKTKRKEPIHLMFGGDLYAPPSGDITLPQRVLELFRKHGHPFQVLTKGGLKAVQDFDLYGPDDRFGVTLTFLDPEKSKQWEPGAALPEERIASLKAANENGIKTWASCEPVIEPEETLAVIKAAAPYVDFFWIGKWNHDERASAIDWLKFKRGAITLLENLGKPYGIKEDLKKAAEKQLTDADLVDILQPEGFTAEEHSKLMCAVDRLLRKKWPLMVQSNYGASLVSESNLPPARIRSWLEAIGCTRRVLEQSGIELWSPPTRTEEAET